jgi:hypothetical protein
MILSREPLSGSRRKYPHQLAPAVLDTINDSRH